MKAEGAIIGCGDTARHTHLRPTIPSASAVAGHLRVEDDDLPTPLGDSTGISRSMPVGRMDALTPDGKRLDAAALATAGAGVSDKAVSAGDLEPKRGSRELTGSRVVSGVVYGLVNVRRHGRRLGAAVREKNHPWEYAVFD